MGGIGIITGGAYKHRRNKFEERKMSFAASVTRDEWVFPHTTCERTHYSNGIVPTPIQPYSFVLNALNAGLLLRSAIKAPNKLSRNAIFSFVLFELLHTFSHSVHYNRHYHEIGIHACGYLMAWTIYQYLKDHTKYELNFWNKLLIMSAIILDLSVFTTVRNIYSVGTGLNVFAFVVLQYFHILPKKQQEMMISLVIGTVILFLMFVVEKQFCRNVFLVNGFEYHPIIVEPWGLLLFQMLASFISYQAPTEQKHLF